MSTHSSSSFKQPVLFTTREKKIILYLLQNKPVIDIEKNLGITENARSFYLYNIQKKLECKYKQQR